jgi:BirA family transcriptional regulator, biotin operon repressor / biotin---[acetyl-CoA-carboxylase] ligase
MLVSGRSFTGFSRMGTARFSLLRVLADGEVHSAEGIGEILGRSSVDAGALVGEIEALGLRVLRTQAGYRLAEPLDLYDARALADQVNAAGLRVEVLDECTSTNAALAQRAKAGAAHGYVLVCEHQEAGRGRRGNSWVSTVGGSLTFSMLWRFLRGIDALAGLGLAVAVGAAQALERTGLRPVALKWPNDLLCEGRKLGGILIDTAGDAPGATAAVIGVGINVRLGVAARARIGHAVTDIASHASDIPSRTVLLAGLLASIAQALELFAREGFGAFRPAWLERHAWQGRRVVLSHADRRVAEGEVVGVADDGALILASSRGIERFHSGELSLRLG